MKVSKITQIGYQPYINSKKQNNNTQQENINNPIIQNGYKDFNINFRGRTPENFYAQEFNVKNMPDTMKTYLNEDYESRKHLPPEQVMNQAFKYLDVIDNFSDVKSIYPNEKLFENLHEANLKGRTGILSDIKIAKEISDTPLLKDGSDDFGMYLLKKIFLEGKTIKEINKDFYAKDLAQDYKGAVTQPITYGTTSAYGIKYPKTDFWNSFIATREEYKKFFVTLPKQDKTDLRKELSSKFGASKNTAHNTSTTNSTETKTPKRKYSIKKYQRDQIKKDIKDAKGEVSKVEKSIRKHFAQDDPEASFIIKYLSPIMTVAADRVHLSEEEKDFAEMLKAKNKKVDNLFAQFWKAKPELLDYYSTMITDTINLFEETYEEGGTIPINNEYEIITDKVKNQKPIDFVSPRFLELLDHVQTIVPNRNAKYAKHDELQKEWEEHFKTKYGEIKQEPTELKENVSVDTIEQLKNEAEKNNGQVYTLHGVNGEDIQIVANLDETFADYIRSMNRGMPSSYTNALINKSLKNPLLTEDAKLSFSVLKLLDKLDDDRILGKTERDCIMNVLQSEMQEETCAASMAMSDIYARLSKYPEKIYRNLQEYNKTEDTQELSKMIMLHGGKASVNAEMNKLYSLYRKQLSDSEKLKISNVILNYIRNFNANFAKSERSVLCMEQEFISTIAEIKKMCNGDKKLQKDLKNKIISGLSNVNFARTLLQKTENTEQYRAKCEIITRAIFTRPIR